MKSVTKKNYIKQINLITKLHKSSKRNYLERMNNNKVICMKEAKKYEKKYWDGPRKYGYGGYKYIPGRWKNVAKKIKQELNWKPITQLDDGLVKTIKWYIDNKNWWKSIVFDN